MIYPWQERTWQQLTEHWQNQPNAWLLLSKANTGEIAFARHFAQALLCEQKSEEHTACKDCPSCHFFAQQSHPDYYELTPNTDEDDANARKQQHIKIDEVRAVLNKLTQTALRGGRRVVLIHPAESMNIQAANALLKMLEEPPESVIFLLVSHQRDRLLPTIKSRCRPLILSAPTQQEAIAYLKQHRNEHLIHLLPFHSNAPLFEYDEQEDHLREQLLTLLTKPRLLACLDYANTFDKQKQPLAHFLDWLHKWLIDLTLTAQNTQPLYYPQHASALVQLSPQLNQHTLFQLIDNIVLLKPYGHHSLNVKIQIESLLLDYLALCTQKTKPS